MNTLLWVFQLILAGMFLVSGSMKLLLSRDQLIVRMGDWAKGYSPGFLKFIGAAEALGAIGVVVPWRTGIAPILTPVASAGLVAIMVGATALHVRRGEIPRVVMNFGIVAMAVVVAWGRLS